ncbi:MAG TPA: hypothetical protein VFZ56_07095 [Gemmatimonadaceae bacterium]
MFLGHFAVGFAAKRVAPGLSLGTLFLAAQFADLLWPNLLLLGVEHVAIRPGVTAVTPLDFISYPYSHSLLALLVWGALFGVAHLLAQRSLAAAILLGAIVVSHWLLDMVAHRPDLPLTLTGDVRVGLELWRSVPATVMVELVLLAAGAAVYAQYTRPRDTVGKWGLPGVVLLLLSIQLGAVFGPPPPSVTAVAWSAQAVWLLVAVGYWVDRHRYATVALPRASP